MRFGGCGLVFFVEERLVRHAVPVAVPHVPQYRAVLLDTVDVQKRARERLAGVVRGESLAERRCRDFDDHAGPILGLVRPTHLGHHVLHRLAERRL